MVEQVLSIDKVAQSLQERVLNYFELRLLHLNFSEWSL